MGELFSATWFQLGGQEDVVATTTGSRPGDSLADATFNFLFAHMLAALTAKLEAEGLITKIHWFKGHRSPWCREGFETYTPVSDIAWMDDLSLLVQDASPQQLLQKTHRALAVLLDSCVTIAQAPNLKAGKTEVLFGLLGPGCRGVRGQLFRDFNPNIRANRTSGHCLRWHMRAV
jgi:hypothetical protein